MTLIIPGVEVKVVKEVLAPQLAPSGVLGLIGLTENKLSAGTFRASSWSSFIELFGAASAFSMPEAAQALANGVFELVVSPVKPDNATAASVNIPMADGKTDKDISFVLTARVPGTWANDLKVTVQSRSVTEKVKDKDGKDTDVDVDRNVFDLKIQRPGTNEYEFHRNLSVDPLNERSVDKVLKVQSQIVLASALKNKQPKENLPKDKPAGTPYLLADGADAGRKDYADALDLLANEPDVDMVLAAVQDLSDLTRLAQIYSDVISHCNLMSTKSQGRIGFGQAPGKTPADTQKNAAKMLDTLLSDRFVLVAPSNVVGAVAGMVGSLDYFQSPTFKTLSGLGELGQALGVETQMQLLTLNAVPIISQRGRGTIVVRGLTTDGDQISVRRVADRAVRGVKTIGELFIGRLNNEQGRGALKQKLVEFLVQMEKDGAIVPSATDKTDPAFQVTTYSSQDDFAKGIVRVDLAVRPVRAIDYIYATVVVQV